MAENNNIKTVNAFTDFFIGKELELVLREKGWTVETDYCIKQDIGLMYPIETRLQLNGEAKSLAEFQSAAEQALKELTTIAT